QVPMADLEVAPAVIIVEPDERLELAPAQPVAMLGHGEPAVLGMVVHQTATQQRARQRACAARVERARQRPPERARTASRSARLSARR
ncbi:MAG: hypothetical protein ABL977_13960, partial [Candidatus Eisenbacteria bacterium]